MGSGPLYSFFVPYHLVHFEVPNAIARAVLMRDPVIRPLGGPVVEVCAVAKRDLKAGEVLDDYGSFMTYGEAVDAGEMCAYRTCQRAWSKVADYCAISPKILLLPTMMSLPSGRLADRLRAQQYSTFRGEN